LILADHYPNDKEQRPAIYARDTEDERLEDLNDSDDDGPNESESKHIEDAKDGDDEHTGDPNDSDDDSSAPQIKRVRKARKQGSGSGGCAVGGFA
jgi:hypothetical protein